MPMLRFDTLTNVDQDKKPTTRKDFLYFWFAIWDRDNSFSNKICMDDKHYFTRA